jgi:hypothetical protein
MYSLYWDASGGQGLDDCPAVFLATNERVQTRPTKTNQRTARERIDTPPGNEIRKYRDLARESLTYLC